VQATTPGKTRSGKQRRVLKVVLRPNRLRGHLDNKLHIVGSFFCEFVSFPKLPLSLEPKLYIPSDGLVVFFPDFPGALSDLFFVGLCQGAGSLLQFFRQSQYALNRFPIGYPPREVAVLMGLREKAGDDLLLIHCALHLE
jgi:hypothetical protein